MEGTLYELLTLDLKCPYSCGYIAQMKPCQEEPQGERQSGERGTSNPLTPGESWPIMHKWINREFFFTIFMSKKFRIQLLLSDPLYAGYYPCHFKGNGPEGQ